MNKTRLVEYVLFALVVAFVAVVGYGFVRAWGETMTRTYHYQVNCPEAFYGKVTKVSTGLAWRYTMDETGQEVILPDNCVWVVLP